jgi:cellobiose phosphorylase
VIPSGWHGFKATRIYRGITYQITVERKGPGNTLTMWTDGQLVSGCVLPLPTNGKKEVLVLVHLS